MLKYIKTVAIYVSDQARAVLFYTEIVGLEIRRRDSMGSMGEWIELAPKGGQSCLVLYPRALMPDWEHRRPSIVFHCADAELTYRELSSRGVTFHQTPQRMPWGIFAQFSDPDGNEFPIQSPVA